MVAFCCGTRGTDVARVAQYNSPPRPTPRHFFLLFQSLRRNGMVLTPVEKFAAPLMAEHGYVVDYAVEMFSRCNDMTDVKGFVNFLFKGL